MNRSAQGQIFVKSRRTASHVQASLEYGLISEKGAARHCQRAKGIRYCRLKQLQYHCQEVFIL